jgi:hypothetical protein
MKSVTAQQVREMFLKSNCEKPVLRAIFEALGIEDDLDSNGYTDGPKGRDDPPNGSMLTKAEWAADRRATHTQMLVRLREINVGDATLYDHPSHACEHEFKPDEWIPAQYGPSWRCTKCGAFRLKMP